jgi:5-oxoprolinase (ATP-hydrolysing)
MSVDRVHAGRFGADTGGTFTDVVAGDGSITKVLSTPGDPGAAVRSGVGALAAGVAGGRPELLAHGTTVATNALLERRGAVVALVTTEGIGDVVEIARQDRPSLYDPFARRPEPLVARSRRLEVRGRLGADGREVERLDVATIGQLAPDVEAAAVCLLHADLDATHEQEVARALTARGVDVTCSHEVSPEMREYERTVTTVANAYLRPRCRAYLQGIADVADEVLVMTSAGGLLPATDAAELPAALLLSGPAGGVRAAAAFAVAAGFPSAVTFDMGGTSTDVCLVLDGEPAPASQRDVAGLPVRFPSLDVHTIGAGGGSIARLDPGGALVVGPQSAGADPGPACYGRGGTEPTVTDANVALGRIPHGARLGGLVLDDSLAQVALARAGVTAAGVIDVVNAEMERALRAVTVERGVDPRGLALVAFGGAGPLHACDLADALGMTTVIVPPRAGVLSAVGLLTAPIQRDLVRSWPTPTDHDHLGDAMRRLGAEAARLVGAGATVETWVDCRYAGQSHEITVPSIDEFHAEHRRRNGYERPGAAVEVIALRARATRPASTTIEDLPVDRRLDAPVLGPRVIAEPDCTIWVPEGWVAEQGAAGTLVLQRAAAPRAHEEPALAAAGGGFERPDPAALQVLISRLTAVADEMGAVLRRAAFSPNIKERADCSAALFTATGELLVQAEHIPVHLGSMPASVRAAIDSFEGHLHPGDQIVLNDPFAGGTHLNDVTLVAPCFLHGRLIGFAANRAHHADVGGSAPGSMPADAREIYEEGLRIPPTKLDDGLRRILLAASRTPEERAGDLDAQVGANVLGVERLASFAEAPLHEVLDYGERRMRAALRALPDGAWHFTDVLDSTGASPDQQQPARIELLLVIEGERATFGFAGTDAQRQGNVNAVEAVTASAVAYALRSAVDPTIPANAGAFRPVTVFAPPGTIVAAQPPAAVGAGNVEVSQRVADVCLGALAGPCPERVAAASQGTMNNLLIGGAPTAAGGHGGWVYYETVAGGQGGAPGHHGMSGVHTHMTNTRNTPIEALERHFPLRVLRYRLREGSGGAGRAPGGDGIERDLQVLEDVTVSLITERRVSQPWGLAGGEPGAPGENWLLPGGFERLAKRLPDKCTFRMKAGDVLRMRTPGGGGWGEPPAAAAPQRLGASSGPGEV